MPAPRRPNLLLIHSDQHRYDCLGAHGHPVLRTPALDRLAAGGTSFAKAFTPCPLCTPARASLLTGTWPTIHRSINIPNTESHRPVSCTQPILPQLLSAAGYHHAWIGKFHHELPGHPRDHGATSYVDPEAYPAWRAARGLPPPPREGGWFGSVDHECPPEATRLAWMTDHVIAELERASCRSDRPFFLRWDPPEPHLPCRPSADFASRYPPELIPPWPSWPDRGPGKPATQLRQKRLWGVEDWTWDQWQPVVARYLAVVAELDHQIGRILERLDQLGLSENTLVAYTSDHGDYCGGHGQMDKHFALYDDLVRVPLLLRWPGRIPSGVHASTFVCNEIDLARTLLVAADIEPPSTFVGQDLRALLRGELPGRDHAFAQYFGTESGSASVRMLRTAEWKYVYHPTGDRDELYDLHTDPSEQVNLSADPLHRETLAALRARLAAAMEEARDPLLNTWTRIELLGAAPFAGRS
jgi:arylsulfatase A-like enzyme